MNNNKTIPINKALILTLGHLDQPVITNYQLALYLWRLYLAGSYQGQRLRIRKTLPEKHDYTRIIKQLLEIGVIEENKDFPRSSVFNLLGKDRSSAEEIACSVDPFAYISHLNAMSYHGLTDRIPQALFLSSPPPPKWKEFARERMDKDLRGQSVEYHAGNLPNLIRINLTKINKRTVHRYSSVHLGAFKSIKKKVVRVSTIGRTFLDMLRSPEFCGGIHHVINVYTNYAERYFSLILDEIDQHGKPVDKVRAGYILEEICGLTSETINGWLKFVQRGGSRKLDLAEEYSSTYSERWCLSLNIE